MNDDEAYEKYLEEYFRNITPEQWQKLKAHLLETYELAVDIKKLEEKEHTDCDEV